jgi:hypothetical protein
MSIEAEGSAPVSPVVVYHRQYGMLAMLALRTDGTPLVSWIAGEQVTARSQSSIVIVHWRSTIQLEDE